MTYRRIRSLKRGIDVLRFLNTVKGAQPADICKELKLPRPTVHRILETLEEMKLVHRGYNAREFRLTDGVKRLAQAKGVYEELYLVTAQRKIENPIASKLKDAFVV